MQDIQKTFRTGAVGTASDLSPVRGVGLKSKKALGKKGKKGKEDKAQRDDPMMVEDIYDSRGGAKQSQLQGENN